MSSRTNQDVDTRYTQERELSWLRFNERVMDEAWDESVPLFERLKFASIFTSNLDEFFMIRVGSTYDMSLMKQSHVDSKSGLTPAEQLSAIFKAVLPLYKQRDKLMTQLEKRLRTCNICNLTTAELDNKERKVAEQYFSDYIRPILSPMVVDTHHPFPHLPSKALTIALSLKKGGDCYYGLVPIPRSLAPYLLLEEQGVRYILTEQLILTYADKLFEGYQVAEKCVIAVTRNADISPEDEDIDVGEDFRQHMTKVLKKRARLAPVRLEIQGEASEELTAFLCARLHLPKEQVFRCKCPLNLGYIFGLEGKLSPESTVALCYPPNTPRWPLGLVQGEKYIPQIADHDVMLYYPFHTMDPFLKLVREARNDPDVLSIKITIYRVASKAKLIEYLAAAAENGKDVTVVMELRARFDEQNNIAWAERLEEAGCTVLYGAEGFKLHSKICLITRREKGKVCHITQIGTGNYNEKTAKLYTDFCLMTANPEIGADATVFFQNMATVNLHGEYKHLLVSPYGLKNQMLGFIDEEIAKAQAGKPARIFIKVNSVTDRKLIDKLAEASQAGVRVVLNVRGICCLRPGIPGLTDNIRIFSIVGRFLEHPRVYVFGADDSAKVYIGSADLMTRNTEHRVEIACPVLDPKVRKQLYHYIALLCNDNVKARDMVSNGVFVSVPQRGDAPVDAQQTMVEEAMTQETVALTAPPTPPAPQKISFFSKVKSLFRHS